MSTLYPLDYAFHVLGKESKIALVLSPKDPGFLPAETGDPDDLNWVADFRCRCGRWIVVDFPGLCDLPGPWSEEDCRLYSEKVMATYLVASAPAFQTGTRKTLYVVRADKAGRPE